MSRRGFVKWLIAAAAMVAAMFYGLFQLLTRVGPESQKPLTAQPETTAPQPETPPTQEAPAAPGKLLTSFFVLSDLHVSIYDDTRSKKLRLALDDITKLEPKADTILLGGDLTDYGMEAEYAELKKILGEFKLPKYYANMGNHDYYDVWIDKGGSFNREALPNGKTDAQSRQRFQTMFGYTDKPYHDVQINGVQILLMSQEAYMQEKPEAGEGAWYSDQQLAWLKAKLKENKPGRPVFIIIHQPLPPAGQEGGSHRVIRGKEFREIVQPYPNVFIVSGHTHQDFENGSSHYTKETFHWFVNSSVGRPSNRNFQANEGNRSQGLHVQVFEDKVVLRGRQFDTKAWIAAADWTIPLERANV